MAILRTASKRLGLVSALAWCGGCSSTAWVGATETLIDAVGNAARENYADADIFATPAEQLSCAMDYRCTKPLTQSQYWARQSEKRYREKHERPTDITDWQSVPEPWR